MGYWIAIADGYAYGIFDSEEEALAFLNKEFPNLLDSKVYELVGIAK